MQHKLKFMFSICLFLLLLNGCTIRQNNDTGAYQKDVTDTSGLKVSEDLGTPSTSLLYTVLPLTSAAAEITVQYENTGREALSYENEIQIDRLIDGTWYFWGETGNTLEGATGVWQGETVKETYAFTTDKMQDGDFYTPYDEKLVIKNGIDSSLFDGSVIIVLFPGTYRARTQFYTLDETEDINKYENIAEFVVTE